MWNKIKAIEKLKKAMALLEENEYWHAAEIIRKKIDEYEGVK